MSRGPDAATLLTRALERSAADAGLNLRIVTADWTRWASATFTGARHEITLSMEVGDAARRWRDSLPEAEFALRGHLVADLVVAASREQDGVLETDLEALTVEAR